MTNSRHILQLIFFGGVYFFSVLLLNIGIDRFFDVEISLPSVSILKKVIQNSMVALGVIGNGDIILLPRCGIKAASDVSSAGFFCFYGYIVFKFRREYLVHFRDLLFNRKYDINQILQAIRNKTPEPVSENPIV